MVNISVEVLSTQIFQQEFIKMNFKKHFLTTIFIDLSKAFFLTQLTITYYGLN